MGEGEGRDADGGWPARGALTHPAPLPPRRRRQFYSFDVDAATWTQLQSATPGPGLFEHETEYYNGRIYLFAGEYNLNNTNLVSNTVWGCTLDLAQARCDWQIEVIVGPTVLSARAGHSTVVVDDLGVLLFGGRISNDGDDIILASNEMWLFQPGTTDRNSWTILSSSNAAIPPRWAQGMTLLSPSRCVGPLDATRLSPEKIMRAAGWRSLAGSTTRIFSAICGCTT